MICESCMLEHTDQCTNNLMKVESVPDKDGFVIIALKCDDYEGDLEVRHDDT